LNIIINCAANIELDEKLDIAVRVNVTGPLNLLKLANDSPGRCCFMQVSTSFVNADRKGFVEERIYDSKVNWLQQYQKILSMSQRDAREQKLQIMGEFPNVSCYSKRMAEELMIHFNTIKMPLVILRPSIIGTSAFEPLPGWTDSTGLLQGAALIVGLGILRDMPGDRNHMADIVPVDCVSRQILISIPFAVTHQMPLMISHCTSSSLNPTNWQIFFENLTKYQNQFPYEQRAASASLTMHKSY
jgi:nucleoside-diphosphate-sugar epimerase